ncbi:hypothetical protein Mgra_00005871 [Meloidogyne graminicola]|uniref:Uncharacterized protein n=1 Tax=Meloidogyne graminicola TaxID=189291 RepID=A0A8S9ZNE3_9BILA|nr:hypothetical protein Mgra_00005871 [Meloidogyne graminicola]
MTHIVLTSTESVNILKYLKTQNYIHKCHRLTIRIFLVQNCKNFNKHNQNLINNSGLLTYVLYSTHNLNYGNN